MIDYEKLLDRLVLSEASTKAAQQAHQAGLESSGYGRWHKKGDATKAVVAVSSKDGNELIYTDKKQDIAAQKQQEPGNTNKSPNSHAVAPADAPTKSSSSDNPAAGAPPAMPPPNPNVPLGTLGPQGSPAPDPSAIGPEDFKDEPDILAKKMKEQEKNPGRAEGPTRARVRGRITPGGDSKIKDAILKRGFSEGFAAPGNPGSCLNEILTGEAIHRAFETPALLRDDRGLALVLYKEYVNTGLAKQNMGGVLMKKPKDKRLVGLDSELFAKMLSTARAGISETRRVATGIQKMGWKLKDAEIHHFYGHAESKKAMEEMFSRVGKRRIFTPEGVPIPVEDAIKFAKNGGAGENPTDTCTVVRNRNGDLIFAETSNKLTPNDIQANSTPIQEMSSMVGLLKTTGVSQKVQEDCVNILNKSSANIDEIEKSLRGSLGPVAEHLLERKAQAQLKELMQIMKSPDSKDRNKTARYKSQIVDKFTSKILNAVSSSGGLTKQSALLQQITKEANPEWKPGSEPSESQKIRAWLRLCSAYKMNDDDSKLLQRSSKSVHGLPSPDETIEKARRRVTLEEYNTIQKLNMFKLPTGQPIGTYLAGRNLVSKLHLDPAFDDKSKHGPFQFEGLLKVNMGGTVVGKKQLQHCLNVNKETEFDKQFRVNKPINIKDKNGRVTGSTAVIYTLDKDGKQHPIAIRTVRSKQGASGRLRTVYQWHPEIQKCFGTNQ